MLCYCLPWRAVNEFPRSVTNLSNGAIKLTFNESGHLSSWTNLHSGDVYPLGQDYVQEVEKVSLDEANVCDSSNVYTFVPDDGSSVLTPKVGMKGWKWGIRIKNVHILV